MKKEMIKNTGKLLNFAETLKSAQNGHLECLDFAVRNGYYYSRHTCVNACIHDKLECFKYLCDLMCPTHFNYVEDMKYIEDTTVRYDRQIYKEYVLQKLQNDDV